MLSSWWWARYVQGKLCFSRAICFVHPVSTMHKPGCFGERQAFPCTYLARHELEIVKKKKIKWQYLCDTCHITLAQIPPRWVNLTWSHPWQLEWTELTKPNIRATYYIYDSIRMDKLLRQLLWLMHNLFHVVGSIFRLQQHKYNNKVVITFYLNYPLNCNKFCELLDPWYFWGQAYLRQLLGSSGWWVSPWS